eukprot:2574703-Rhodomonas_salina.1
MMQPCSSTRPHAAASFSRSPSSPDPAPQLPSAPMLTFSLNAALALKALHSPPPLKLQSMSLFVAAGHLRVSIVHTHTPSPFEAESC